MFGDGFKPVIIDNEPELKFLKFTDPFLTDPEDYYVGGTTNKFETMKFEDYIPNNSGKWTFFTQENF